MYVVYVYACMLISVRDFGYNSWINVSVVKLCISIILCTEHIVYVCVSPCFKHHWLTVFPKLTSTSINVIAACK